MYLGLKKSINKNRICDEEDWVGWRESRLSVRGQSLSVPFTHICTKNPWWVTTCFQNLQVRTFNAMDKITSILIKFTAKGAKKANMGKK